MDPETAAALAGLCTALGYLLRELAIEIRLRRQARLRRLELEQEEKENDTDAKE